VKSLKKILWAVGIAGLLVLQACRGGGSSTGGAEVRLINATRNHPSIDLIANGSALVTGVATQQASASVGVSATAYTIQITDTGSQTALATVGPSFAANVNYSLLVYEADGAVKVSFVGQSDAAAAAGHSNLRVYDAAIETGALDVYVTAPNVDLTAAGPPSFSIGGSGNVQVSGPLAFATGTYRIRVTTQGSVSDVRLDIPSILLGEQQVQYLVLTPTAGGALVDGAVLVDGGGYTGYPNTNARVRLVSGVTSGLVAAAVGSNVVQSGAQSPNIGSYVTVPSGSATWAITVNGISSAVPPITLGAGSDNTVLLTGTPAASTATPLLDDSKFALTTSTAALRLLNGLSNSSAGVSLSVDFNLLDDNVLPATSSQYLSVATSTNMRLEVDSTGSSTPLWLQSGVDIPADGAYTVFVIGDAANPEVTMLRDR